MKQTTLTILGAGYTAGFTLTSASQQYAHVWLTSREPERNLTHVPPKQRLLFDLAREHTWSNIPHGTDLLWCFPASPVDSIRRFTAHLKESRGRLVVLGSTSAYDVAESHDFPPPWIDETAPIDVSKPRVQGEEWLRKEYGAIVLRVAGIYGPGRNPVDWIKSGRVGPSRKYVNLVHVGDLAAVCIAALERGTPGDVYNVSDGTPRTWEEICQVASDRWGITPLPGISAESPGKRIDTDKLVKELYPQFLHPDLYSTLAELIRS